MTKNRLATFVVMLLVAAAHGQSVTPKSDQQNSSKDQVVRLSVTLVQVDAVVTDTHGKQVTDLKPSDFIEAYVREEVAPVL